MTLQELATKCAESIATETWITLVIPGPPPHGEMIRIDRKSRGRCPMGEVLNWTDRDGPQTVAIFDPTDVLAWLVANGAAAVEATHGEVNP